MQEKFDWDDILIEPAVQTDIKSRKDIDVFRYNFLQELPLIAAPMDTVVSLDNISVFLDNKINVCLPRGLYPPQEYLNDPRVWYSVGLQEFEELIKKDPTEVPSYVLIDIANGHTIYLCNAIKRARKKFDGYINKYMTIMAGNIANPEAYFTLSDAGADYIRVGIGAGGGCLSTVQLGVGYPMASLIQQCANLKQHRKNPAKIVADGGFKTYSDIIKALALGSDIVMVGSLFNKSIESAGHNYLYGIPISDKIGKYLFTKGFPIKKKFRGMSTKEVQKAWGKAEIKTSEGIVTFRKVEYTLSSWTENFRDYLASAMSYTNKKTLDEFIGKVKFNFITTAAFRRFNK
jgi:GMP reductase